MNSKIPLTLSTLLCDYFRLTGTQKSALKKLGISSVEDLLYHFPVRYGDTSKTQNIDTLLGGDTAIIYGKILNLKLGKGFRSRMSMAEADIEDATGHIHCIWFRQPYIAKMFQDGNLVRIEGKVSEKKNLYFSNPKIERVDKLPIDIGDSLFGQDSETHTLYPIYPESQGISSNWIYHTIQKIFKSGLLKNIPEPIPVDILKKYHLPKIETALIWIHTPLKDDDATSARKRFSFEEIFTIQLGKQIERKNFSKYSSFQIDTDISSVQQFIKRFPFLATTAQNRAVETIIEDMNREHPMSRLLEGDVGSGKTAVAAATAYAVITANTGGRASRVGNLQVAYMCPTEILATQHFESFIQYFAYLGIEIGLITSSGCRKFPSKVNPKSWTDISRAQLLKWVAGGEIKVLVGTHALIQKSVIFKNLAYVIIDEQHRFGTSQRAQLVKKVGVQSVVTGGTNKGGHIISRTRSGAGVGSRGNVSSLIRPADSTPIPHLLSMTATPIPRTLALTMYGDLDLTLLDESPVGRKAIITELVMPDDRNQTYEKIRRELQSGRQVYVICPRINEPDPTQEAALNAKSVSEESKRLQKDIFPEYRIDILHSKMTSKEKDEVMTKFKNGIIEILCATSVVEVGVNVPNATVIIIEGAERFGLAQLHQLRGRVFRSNHQAYCYIFTESTSVKSIARLKALQSAKNGFELAELDLAARGAGTLSGTRQWGVSDIAMEALNNLKMVEAARSEAVRLIEEDENLMKYKVLKQKVKAHKVESHFE